MSLILTLALEHDSRAHFETLRQRHFPPERNQIPAHVTLFHQLPDTGAVRGTLQQAAEGRQPFPVQVTGLRSLGKGVAYTLSSPPLLDLHRVLSTAFQEHLNSQDRQRFAPHIVVQNKVGSEQARQLLIELRQQFVPSIVKACGLDLWQYLGGPWSHVQTFAFSG